MNELYSLPKHGFVDRVVPRHEFRSEIARLFADCVHESARCVARSRIVESLTIDKLSKN